MNLHLDIRTVYKKLLSSNHELEDSRPSPFKELEEPNSIKHPSPILTQAFFKSLLRGGVGGRRRGEGWLMFGKERDSKFVWWVHKNL
jgi:hypothetical protein